MVLSDVIVICDHEVVKSKTFGKLCVKCAGCGSHKKWPWTKMVKCHHCKRLWHRLCAPSSRSLPHATEDPGNRDAGDKPTVVAVEPSGGEFVQPINAVEFPLCNARERAQLETVGVDRPANVEVDSLPTTGLPITTTPNSRSCWSIHYVAQLLLQIEQDTERSLRSLSGNDGSTVALSLYLGLFHTNFATSRPLPCVAEGPRDRDAGYNHAVVAQPSVRRSVRPNDAQRSSSRIVPRTMLAIERAQSETSTAFPSTIVAENIVSVRRNERWRTLSTALQTVEAETGSIVPESQRRPRQNTVWAPRNSPQNTGLIFVELSRCGLVGRLGANVTPSRPLQRTVECSPTRVAESRQGFDSPQCAMPSRPTVCLNQSQSENSTSNVTKSNVTVTASNEYGVRQTIVEVIVRPKMHFLLDLLSKIDDCQSTVIVFVNDIVCADRVAALLNVYKYPAASIHRGKKNYENRIITNLNNKVIRILVATDGYSRLIDRTNAKLVVNYDLTKTIHEYTLRVKHLSNQNIESNVEVVSFFLRCNDENLAPSLVRTLRRSNQIIPPFLLRDE